MTILETLDYTNKTSLKEFAKEMKTMPYHIKKRVIVECLNLNLMSWSIPLRIMRFFFDAKKIEKAFIDTLALSLYGIDNFWDSVLDHMVNGKDTYDPKSAGGWCEEELATFIQLILNNGYEEI